MKNKRDELLDILLVEDDDIIARLHRFALENLVENEVKILENGQKAIDHLENIICPNKKVFILLDLNMPVMNGWQFLESLHTKEYAEKVYVAILTSSSYNEDFQKSKKYDRVIGYYTKPLTRPKLIEILESHEQITSRLERPVVRRGY